MPVVHYDLPMWSCTKIRITQVGLAQTIILSLICHDTIWLQIFVVLKFRKILDFVIK